MQTTNAITIKAKSLRPGQWILHKNSSQNQRVVEVTSTRDGEIKVSTDYGNGGEPATSFYGPGELLLVNGR